MLKQRLLTALLGIPLLVAVVWFDRQPLPWFTFAALVWGLLAVREFYRLAATSKFMPLTYFGILWTLLFIASRDSSLVAALGPGFNPAFLIPLLLTSGVILSLVWLLGRRQQKSQAFANWAWTMGGVLYVGWLLGYLMALRGLGNDESGRNWTFFALFVTFASDSAAFFVGRSLGRHHLAPYISPAKTWEGTIGGLAGAIIVSLLFMLPTPLGVPLTWWQAVLLGLLVSVAGQLGDLVKSLFKRNAGVKDSGRLLPGHGGALDRMDSVVFAAVVVYYYVVWVVH